MTVVPLLPPVGACVVRNHGAQRVLGPLSLGEATAVAGALNGLRRVKLLMAITVPGGVGAPGDVVDLPAGEARALVYQKQALIEET